MSESIELKFDAAPTFGPIYKGILLGKRKGFREGSVWPQMRSHWAGARADAGKVAQYRAATGTQDDGLLPLLYPHVLSSPLHLGIFAHPAFPLSALGGVHARNVIVLHRPIKVDEALDFVCELQAPHILKGGMEFEIKTEARVGKEIVWEARSAYLFRGKFGPPEAGYESPRQSDLGATTRTAEWRVPVDMGRRYAKICGDYNPIHISKILAKLFGFKRDLIHGMWSAAKSLSEAGVTGGAPVRFEVIFKGPIWIGAKTQMRLSDDGPTKRFDLFCEGNDRPCLNGLVNAVAPGERA